MGDYTANVLGTPPSLASFFANWRHNKGGFLRYEGEFGPSRLSYRDAALAAEGFAEYLYTNGIVKGDRIVLWGENRPEWIAALWGCLLAGVVAVPVDFRSSGALAARISGIVEAKALLAGEGLTAPEGISCSVWPLEHVLETPRAAHAAGSAQDSDLAEVLFTSGATGDPKGVTLTHRNILANLKPIALGIGKYRRYIRLFAPIRFLNLLPLSHMFGQSMAAFIPPLISGEVLFSSSYSPRDIVRIVKRRRVSVLVCVPQILDVLRQYVLAAYPEASDARRSEKWYSAWWQYRRVHAALGFKFWSFVVGAAALDPELEAFWRKLGFVVIQGYGLTETAPVATLNHPFETKQGTVGKAIGGVEIRIADDGEVLLRGENVTPRYYGEAESGVRDPEGWLHTGDVGSLDESGRLRILGRKKELIVSPDGLNIYPEDVERVLNAQAGMRESAVVAAQREGREQVHAVLVLEAGADAAAVVSAANAGLETHQRIRDYSVWTAGDLPRTPGTNKLKRVELAKWVAGAIPAQPAAEPSAFVFNGRAINPESSLDDLGLSSLDRIQFAMEVERSTGTRVAEKQFAQARTVRELLQAPAAAGPINEPIEFPEWNRSLAARIVRRIALPLLILPLTRAFAWLNVQGRENLKTFTGPVIFASNHQSHFDVPSILAAMPARIRYRVAPAMAKEFFNDKGFGGALGYFLAALVFNAFPLPQREAGTRDALRYAGDLASDCYSILIFPEGKRTDAGEIAPFLPGVGLLSSKLRLPVVPVRIDGLDRVLHRTAKMAKPGRARIRFGAAIARGDDSDVEFAARVRDAVNRL